MIEEYYISVDVETEGPIPGDYSMVQLGAVFYTPKGEVTCEKCWNIERLPGSKIHPGTQQWLDKMESQNPGFLKRLYSDQQSPDVVMWDFSNIIDQCNQNFEPHRPVVVCFPSTFDYMFLLWYGHHFRGDQFPLDFASCLDQKSYAAATLGINYRDSKKKIFPNRWKNQKMPHSHNALADARGQGWNWLKMREESQALSKVYKSIQENLAPYSISWKSATK